MAEFEERIIKAHTDQMNGDITPDEYVKTIREVFNDTVAFQQLAMQQVSHEAYMNTLKSQTKAATQQHKDFLEIIKLVKQLAPPPINNIDKDSKEITGEE